MPFEDLFAQHVATAMARQLALADLIGDRSWSVDLSAGFATFGDDLRQGLITHIGGQIKPR